MLYQIYVSYPHWYPLPFFVYCYIAQIQAGLPQLLLVKELMTSLVNDEDSYGECGTHVIRPLISCFQNNKCHFNYCACSTQQRAGYYLATMEAATQHIFDLAEQYERTVLAPQLSSSSIGSGGVGPLGGTGAGVGVIGALHGLDDNGEELIYGFDDKLLLP